MSYISSAKYTSATRMEFNCALSVPTATADSPFYYLLFVTNIVGGSASGYWCMGKVSVPYGSGSGTYYNWTTSHTTSINHDRTAYLRRVSTTSYLNYNVGGEYSSLPSVVGGDSDSEYFYAWEAPPTEYVYLLYFNANGGSGAPSSQRYPTTGTTTDNIHSFLISNQVPTKSGATFLGWATYQSATTPQYQPLQYITLDGDEVSTVTLWAVWKEIAPFYWFGSETADAANIKKDNTRVMTATMWDSFADTVDTLASMCGVTVSISRPSSNTDMLATQYNSAVTALTTIKNSKSAFSQVSIPQPVTRNDDYITANQFQGTGSIKGALNAMIALL